MKVRHQSVGSFRVAKIQGGLSNREATGFRNFLSRELQSQSNSLVLDLSGVTRSSPRAVGVLLEYQKRFHEEGKRLVVLSPAPGVKELLIQTKVDKIMSVVGSKDELINKM